MKNNLIYEEYVAGIISQKWLRSDYMRHSALLKLNLLEYNDITLFNISALYASAIFHSFNPPSVPCVSFYQIYLSEWAVKKGSLKILIPTKK